MITLLFLLVGGVWAQEDEAPPAEETPTEDGSNEEETAEKPLAKEESQARFEDEDLLKRPPAKGIMGDHSEEESAEEAPIGDEATEEEAAKEEVQSEVEPTANAAETDDIGAGTATDQIPIHPAPYEPETGLAFVTQGDIRVFAAETSDFPVDAEGTTLGAGMVVNHRTRLGAGLVSDEAKLLFEGDFFSGQVAGDPWDIPGQIDQRNRQIVDATRRIFRLRKVSLLANLPSAQVETGMVTSHWGLGMLANDGAHDPMFGHTEFGDKVLRARVTTKPSEDSPWYITGAFDRVLFDDLVTDPRRQWATQGILSLLRRDEHGAFGVYGVMRDQEEVGLARKTQVAVLDVFADSRTPLHGGTLRLAVEAAGITGHTNRATTYNARRDVRIRSAGATGISTWTNASEALTAGISGGWASGDGDPDDDVSNDFTFDRDFGVGMILFDEVMGGVEAATHTMLVDPDNTGRPPDGVETTVTEGAFRRATYLQPHVEFQPVDWLGIRSGVVLAWATAPVRQAFYSFRNGGTPMNHHGVPTDGYALGTEFDAGMTLGGEIEAMGLSQLAVDVQGGIAILGEALQGDGPDQVQRVMATVRARW